LHNYFEIGENGGRKRDAIYKSIGETKLGKA
jgi:hypothetical protein